MVQVTHRVTLLALTTDQPQEEAFLTEFYPWQKQLDNLIIPVINENHLVFHYTHPTHKPVSKWAVAQKLPVNSIKDIDSVLCRCGRASFQWAVLGPFCHFCMELKSRATMF